MGCYKRNEWKRKNLFQEVHYIAEHGAFGAGTFCRCLDFFESEYFPGYRANNYHLPQVLYTLVCSGKAVCVQSDGKINHEYTAGQLVICRQDERLPGTHDEVVEAPYRRLGLLVSRTPVHDLLLRTYFPKNPTFFTLAGDRMNIVKKKFLDIKREMENGSSAEEVSQVFLELLQILAGWINQPCLPDLLRRVLNYIDTHQDVSLPQLAAFAGCSTKTLARLFISQMNVTPGKYIILRRLEKARALIPLPGLQIKEIAARCGFRSANFLAYSFRKEYGITPREYREGKEPLVRKDSLAASFPPGSFLNE